MVEILFMSSILNMSFEKKWLENLNYFINEIILKSVQNKF